MRVNGTDSVALFAIHFPSPPTHTHTHTHTSFSPSFSLSLDCLWKGSVYCTTLVQFQVFLVIPTYPSHCCCLSSWLFRRQYAELSSPPWAPALWTSSHSGSGTGHASAGSPSAPSESSAAPWKCPASFSRKSSVLLTRVRHYRIRTQRHKTVQYPLKSL